MNFVYNFHNAFKRSMFEITSNTSYDFLCKYLGPSNKEKLPEDVVFKIAAGKKNYDVIRRFQSGELFFSQKFIDVLSQFIDMSNKCYPINIEGIEDVYYVIYNLPEYPYLNREKAMFDGEPDFYSGTECPPIFTITGTRLFVVTEEIKQIIIKNKISNIYFTDSFLCTEEEYRDWQINRIDL